MSENNLLLELGTEELPPKALRKLATSLHDEFVKRLNSHGLTFKESKWYATPRRLALIISGLIDKQEDKEVEIKGPAIKAAFDANGLRSAVGNRAAGRYGFRHLSDRTEGRDQRASGGGCSGSEREA